MKQEKRLEARRRRTLYALNKKGVTLPRGSFVDFDGKVIQLTPKFMKLMEQIDTTNQKGRP